MSIFNNVRNSSHPDEIRMLVRLKYGIPVANENWLETLPESVIRDAATKCGIASFVDIEDQIEWLSIMMTADAFASGALEEALIESLVQYHMLLG